SLTSRSQIWSRTSKSWRRREMLRVNSSPAMQTCRGQASWPTTIAGISPSGTRGSSALVDGPICLLVHVAPRIHVNRRTRCMIGQSAGEKDHGRSDVLGFGDAVEREVAYHLLAVAVDEVARHVGRREPGSDGKRHDALLSVSARDRSGKGYESAFRRSVRRVVRRISPERRS